MKEKSKTDLMAAGLQLIPYLSHTIEPFLQQNPCWAAVFYGAIGLYGTYMAFNQDEVNNFVNFIKDHPQEFRKEIVQSEEFKKAFLNSFETYLKVRNQWKRNAVQKILLKYCISEEKEKFEIERLNQVLFQVSLESLEYLNFIAKEVLPVVTKAIEDEIARVQKGVPEYDAIQARISLKKVYPLTKYIYKHIYQDYDINDPEVQRKHGYDHLSNEEKAKWINKMAIGFLPIQLKFEERITELVSLGILRAYTQERGLGTLGGGSISNEANFTNFGYQFLDFIQIT